MVTKELANLFGLDFDEISTIHTTLDDLRKSKLGMVIGKCIYPIDVSINRGEFKGFKPGNDLVMSIGIYDKLQYTEVFDVDQNVKDQIENILKQSKDPSLKALEKSELLGQVYELEKSLKTKTKKLAFEPSEKKFHDLYKPYNGEDLSGKTLLVWRTGGIGDILFIQPCLMYLKKKYPTCKIWFACSPNYLSLFHKSDYIDEQFSFPYHLERLYRADYHCTFEGVIERCREAETTNAYKLFAKWMKLDIPENELQPKLNTKKDNDRYVEDIMNKLKIPKNEFIYLQPRASVLLRSPGIKHWLLVISDLLKNKKTIVFNGEPQDHELLETALNKRIAPEDMKYVRVFSKYSNNISVAISLMKYAKLIIAPDSSAIHLAAALGKQCYGIYAPFPGDIRMSTYKKCKWTIPTSVLSICQWGGKNCCQHQRHVCEHQQFSISPCFDLIDYAKVREEINKLVE